MCHPNRNDFVPNLVPALKYASEDHRAYDTQGQPADKHFHVSAPSLLAVLVQRSRPADTYGGPRIDGAIFAVLAWLFIIITPLRFVQSSPSSRFMCRRAPDVQRAMCWLSHRSSSLC